MSVLVYGIARSIDGTIEGSGIESAPLRAVQADSLLAIVSDHFGRGPQRTPETLWEYGQVVERIAARHTLLPARFGSVLDDDNAVVEMLGTRRQQFLGALERTRGAVEVALSASWDQPALAKDDSQTGSGYLNARLEIRRRAREIAGALTPLGKLARASTCELPGQPAEPMRCAYLLDDDRLDEFTAVVEQLDGRLDDVELVCTGPWPPYSFVEGAPA